MLNRLKHARGFSLLETIMGIAILGIVTMGATTVLNTHIKGFRTTKMQITKEEVFLSLSRNLISLDNLHHSATAHPGTSFHACIYGSGSCSLGVWADFDLYVPPVLPSIAERRIAGTSANPVYYSVDGVMCAGAGPTCPFKVYAQFQPVCVSSPGCTIAEEMKLNVIFEQDANVKVAGTSVPVKRKLIDPPTSQLIFDIKKAKQLCNPGQQLQGIDTAGKPICTVPCKPGEYFQGLQSDGVTPDCKPMPNCPTGTYFTGGLNKDGTPVCGPPPSCPAGQFFNKFIPGTTTPDCQNVPPTGLCVHPMYVTNISMEAGKLVAHCGPFPVWNGNCQPGHVAVGFVMDTNKTQCVPTTDVLPTWGGNCAPGQYAVGFVMNTNKIQCLNLPPPPPPPPMPEVLIVYGDLDWFVAPNAPQCTSLENPPMPDAFIPPGEALPKQRYRNHHIGYAVCPAGYKVTGGGADCQIPGNAGTMQASLPANANGGTNNAWKVDCCNYVWEGLKTKFPNAVYAMCVKVQ